MTDQAHLESKWPKQRMTRPLEQEVFLNLVRAYETLSVELARLCKSHGLSPFQHNVLRILRGAGINGLPSLSIAERMVNRIPDVTRLIDRLETMGLVERARTADDRRVVLVRLTEKGLDLLAQMDQPIVDLHVEQLKHMSREQLHQLDELLRVARNPTELAPERTPHVASSILQP